MDSVCVAHRAGDMCSHRRSVATVCLRGSGHQIKRCVPGNGFSPRFMQTVRSTQVRLNCLRGMLLFPLSEFVFSVGYPVVTLGFGFKSYISYKLRIRKQHEVQKENDFYFQLLRQALPADRQHGKRVPYGCYFRQWRLMGGR